MAVQIRYYRNFAVGRSTHIVETYDSYTKEQGLQGRIEGRESGRIAECLKGLDLTPEQLKRVKELARDRSDGIVLDSGEYRSY